MSQLAVIHQLADALVAELAAQAFSLPCSFTANDLPELVLDRLSAADGLVGFVVAEAWNEEGQEPDEFGLWLVLAKKLSSTDKPSREAGSEKSELRALVRLVEEVRGFLHNRRITYDAVNNRSALWRRAGNMAEGKPLWPIMAKHRVLEANLFVSGTYLVYAT